MAALAIAEAEFLQGVYGRVGIRLATEGAPVAEAPPFGGATSVSWTDSGFAEVRWKDRVPNPAQRGAHVSFEGLPEHHAWTARFFLWALENAETASSARGRARPRSGSAARGHMALFNALVAHAQALGRARLMDLTQADVERFLLGHLGLVEGGGGAEDKAGKAKQRSVARQFLSTLRRLHDLGPNGDYYVPDGLSFDPEPPLAWILAHPGLAEPGGTEELDEEIARKLANAAILWIENYAEPLMRLQGLVDSLERWKDASGLAGRTLASHVVKFLDEQPDALQEYKALRHAFPAPIDLYYQQFLGVDPVLLDASVLARLEEMKRRELARIAAVEDVQAYRVGLTIKGLVQEANLGGTHEVRASPGMLKAFELARSEIERALASKRAAGQDPAGEGPRTERAPGTAPDPEDLILYAEFIRVGQQLAALEVLMTGMCYAAFAIFNGWRVSEVLSVEDGFANTVAVGGEVGSKVRKTSLEPDAVVNRPVPPIVLRASEVLAEMNGLHMTKGDKRLFRNARGNPAHLGNIEVALRLALRQVDVKRSVDTHQFRRFFVYFYLRRFRGNVDALRRHFRHVSRNMIWAYARDAANAQHLAREEKRLALDIVEGIVHGKGYSSRHVAQDIRAQYRAMNLPPKEAEAWLRRVVGDKYSAVHPSEFGYCLFQRGDVGAACEAKTGPVLARAAPETCGGCKFQVTGDEHVEFWQTVALLHQEIIECALHVPMLKEASRTMLKTCEGILARHGMLEGTETVAEPEMEATDE